MILTSAMIISPMAAMSQTTQGEDKSDKPVDDPALDETSTGDIITIKPIDETGALTLQDALRYSAGVRTEVYGLDPRSDYGFVRGVEVPVFQDGIRRPFGYRAGARPELFTLSRIDILRGPAGMLFDHGASGGILNLVTKQPEFETDGEIFLSAGSFDRKEIGVDITGPIIGDKLSGRLIGLWRDSKSQSTFVSDRRWLVNGALTWAIGPDTSLTVRGQTQRDESGWSAQFFVKDDNLDPQASRLPVSIYFGEPSSDMLTSKSDWVTAHFSHQFSHVVTLRSAFRYDWQNSAQFLHSVDVDSYEEISRNDPGQSNIEGFGPGRVIHRYAHGEMLITRSYTFDNQLEIEFNTGSVQHKILTGFDYTRIRSIALSTEGHSASAKPGATPINIDNPVYGNVVEMPYFHLPAQKQTHLGIYMNTETRIKDRAIITMGIRRDVAINRIFWDESRFADQATTFRGGVMVKIGRGLVPYVNYSQSFLPFSRLNFVGQPYEPQRGRQFELGLKWNPKPGTSFHISAYDLMDKNRLLTDRINPLNWVQAGRVHTQGFEIEFSKAIANNFEVTANYSYTRAKDKNAGNLQVESVPKHLASIWASKFIPLGSSTTLHIGAGLRYVAESYSKGRTDIVTSPDYMLADMVLGITRGRWNMSINAINLFDKKYYATCLGRGDCYQGARRTVNLNLGFRF